MGRPRKVREVIDIHSTSEKSQKSERKRTWYEERIVIDKEQQGVIFKLIKESILKETEKIILAFLLLEIHSRNINIGKSLKLIREKLGCKINK